MLLLADTLYLKCKRHRGVLYSQGDILYRQIFLNLIFFTTGHSLGCLKCNNKLWIFGGISACLEFVLIAAGDNYLVDLFEGGKIWVS